MISSKPAANAAVAVNERRDSIRTLYMESLQLVERLHRRLLDVIKDEFDRNGRSDINAIQAIYGVAVGNDLVLSASANLTPGTTVPMLVTGADPGVTVHLDPVDTFHLEARVRQAIEHEILRWIAEHDLQACPPVQPSVDRDAADPKALRCGPDRWIAARD